MNNSRETIFVMLKHAARFGVVAGAVLSVVTTIVMTAWDWLENPGGIFRSEAGTNWQFVLDTATSWLLPTFGQAALIAAAGHLLVSGIRRAAAIRRGGH
jgi:hypothetical protein